MTNFDKIKKYLETGDGGLEDRHGEADDGEDDEHVEGARGEVGEVEHGVEQLVSCQCYILFTTNLSRDCSH